MKKYYRLLVPLLLFAAILLAACGPEPTALPTPAATVPLPTPAATEPTAGGAIYGQAVVEEIDILILESFPVQVNVVARGYFPDGCTGIDEVRQERAGQAFQVTITTIRPADAMCTEAIVPFEQVVSLDVAGLEAGTYTVDVNGVTGTFTLAVDNVAPVEPPPSGQLEGGVLATFDVNGEQFQAWITNPQTIQQVLDLAAGESMANIPNGRILRGPGAADHNLPWSWHLDSEEIEMAEMTIEVCDGAPSYVEEHLDEFVDNVGRYCPWNARLVGVDVRTDGGGDGGPFDSPFTSPIIVLPDPDLPVLTWHREGGIAGFCDDLAIDVYGLVDAAPCAGGPSQTVAHGPLDAEDQALLQGWLAQYRSFEVEQIDGAPADAMTIRLTFAGIGKEEPGEMAKRAILDFAAETYAAFMGTE